VSNTLGLGGAATFLAVPQYGRTPYAADSSGESIAVVDGSVSTAGSFVARWFAHLLQIGNFRFQATVSPCEGGISLADNLGSGRLTVEGERHTNALSGTSDY